MAGLTLMSGGLPLTLEATTKDCTKGYDLVFDPRRGPAGIDFPTPLDC